MPPAIQDTLLQLFDQVRQYPVTMPTVPVEDWQEGSVERRLLSGFQGMLEQVRQRLQQSMQMDQQLREREEQYRSIFEASADGLHIIDLENSQVVEVNPAACKMYGYTREEMLGHSTTLVEYDETQHILINAFEVIKAGGQFQTRDTGRRKDGTVFNIEVRATPFTYTGKPHMLAIDRDITEQVQAQQLLEQRVEERTRELSSLLEISHTVASTLQLKPLLGLILDQLKTVVDCTGSSILTVDGEDLVFLDNRSPVPEEQLTHLRFPLKRLGLIWQTMTTHESIIIRNVHDDSPLAQAFRVAVGDLPETTFRFMRACMIVPLMLRDQVIGMLVLAASEEDAFTQHHAALALAIANQAAIAIENAQLYQQAQELAALEERQRLARELHDSVSQARHGITVLTQLCEEPDLPLKVKQELYRIAQEAMHNTVKHARARKVDLRLSQAAKAVILEVRDDGVGFDPLGSFPGHLGLHSMQERVSSLGGMLQIESAPGQGTSILAQVPEAS